MSREKRIDYPSALHHVMIHGVAGQRMVRGDGDCEILLATLGGAMAESGATCVAWAILHTHMHLLMRTGSEPLSRIMQRWLTRYAETFNLRHSRMGHVFQGRYKAILVEEERYLLEVVRYIHLNPLRAGMVRTVKALATFPWTGHPEILGIRSRKWQDTRPILSRFGQSDRDARRRYCAYLEEGLEKVPAIDGVLNRLRGAPWRGGRRTQIGGARDWRQSDARILGQPGFVRQAMGKVREADRRHRQSGRRISPADVLRRAAEIAGVSPGALRHLDRRRPVALARALASKWLVEDLGVHGIVVAALLHISPSGVTRAVARGRKIVKARRLALDPRSQ